MEAVAINQGPPPANKGGCFGSRKGKGQYNISKYVIPDRSGIIWVVVQILFMVAVSKHGAVQNERVLNRVAGQVNLKDLFML